MKNNFNLDELEEFLSDSAEQHRMYPSDKVWRNINKELHGNKSWPALTFGAILTGAVITAGLILIHPDKNLLTANFPELPAKAKSISGEPQNGKNQNISKNFSLSKVDNANHFDRNGVVSGDASNSDNANGTGAPSAVDPLVNTIPGNLLVATTGAIQQGQVAHVENTVGASLEQLVESEDQSIAENEHSFSSRSFQDKNGIFSPADLGAVRFNTLSEETTLQKAATSFGILPGKEKKWSSFFYITPSVSYRYLTEAKVVDLHYNGPVAPNFTNSVNKFVRHNPTFGFEAGGGMMYQLSKSVRVRMGLQANIRGYSIDAYSSKREPSTIVLSRGGYYNDSIVAMSTISNMEGYQQIKITNRYFELSAPLTLDLQVAQMKKVQFYLAAGLQPTYQFNNNMYMVSADYKNYVQNPDLARHFNINTSVEAYLSYKKGGLTWQVGPQLRYQLLSGAVNQYPVREHLFDYGLKIGVVKTLK